MDWPIARIATGIVRAASLVTYLADVQLGGSPTLLTNVAIAHHIAALATDDVVLVILPPANLPTPAPLVLAVIKTSLPASSAETITGLKTFDRDPAAPFAVTPGSAVVPNLDADKVDGLHAATSGANDHVVATDDSGFVQLAGLGIGATASAANRITMADGGSIGQAAGPLVTFNDTNNYLEITGCRVGIGTTTPTVPLDIVLPAGGISNLRLAATAGGSDRPTSIELWGTGGDGAIHNSGRIGSVFLSPYSWADAVVTLQTPTGAGTWVTALLAKNGTIDIGASLGGTLDVSGTIYATLSGVASGSVMYWNANQLQYASSTRQVKTDIRDFEFAGVRDSLLGLRLRSFRWRPALGGHEDVGLIAEEVAEAMPLLVNWGPRTEYAEDGSMVKDGRGVAVSDPSVRAPQSVRYEMLSVYLLALAQEQGKRLCALEERCA